MILTPALCLAGVLLTLLSTPAVAARLVGSVTSSPAVPIVNATVVLDGPTGPVATTHTSATGAFVLEAPEGEYTLRVVAEGFDAPARRVTLRDEAEASADVTMGLAAVSEQVVVSAGFVPLTRSASGASLTVLDQAELHTRQLESSQDALRSVPGFTVSRSGGRGAVTSIFPRGGESDFTLIMVDGIRLNDMGGSYDAAHLPLFDVERVEVVRGPQSAIYGSDAVGGVVQLVSRRGGPLRATGLVEGGTFGTWRANGAANGTSGRLRWGGAEQLTTDGYTGIAPGTGETVSNDDYSRTDGMGSLGYLTDRWQLTGLIRGGRNERGVPGPFGSDPNDTYTGVDTVSRNDNETLAAGASAAWRFAPAFQARGSFTYANRDSTFLSIYTPDAPTASSNRMWAARGQVDGAWLGLSWTAGTEWTGERAASSFITGLQDQEIPVERTQLGLFGEGRFELGRLSIQGGARFEQVVRGALEGNNSVFSPRPAFAEDTVSVINPRVAVSWRALGGDDWWARLHGGFGTGMRAPGAFEIAFTDNPGLKPEKTRSLEGGVETGWLDGRLVADVLYFRNDYDDLIVTVSRVAGTTSYRSDNVSNALSEGVEASVSFRPVAALTLRGGLIGQHTEILANDGRPGAPTPFEVGDPLLRRPELAGFVDALVTAGRVSGFVRVDNRGEVNDIDPSFGANAGIFVNPGYTTADAGVSVRLLDQVEVFGRALNLFDKQYEEIYGFPSLGRSVMVGVRLATSR